MKIKPNQTQMNSINAARRVATAKAEEARKNHHRLLYKPLNEVLIEAIAECRNGSYATKIIRDVIAERKIKRLSAPIGELCQKRG